MGSGLTQGDLWGQSPKDWAELQEPQHLPLWEAMCAATEVSDGTRFLDAGCGCGGLSALAVEKGAEVCGLDAADAFINIAKEKVPSGDFQTGDFEELPYDDDCFNAILAANSVQYAADPVAALMELKRVCKPGGRIAIGIWGQAENCEFRFIMKAIVETLPEPPKGGGPFTLSEPGALEGLLAKAGLTADGREELACPFIYPDVDTMWRAISSAGPTQGAMRAVGEAPIKEAITTAAKQFTDNKGEVRIENTMLYVRATV